VAGVLGGGDAAIEDSVVARTLALFAKLAGGEPDEWVEPEGAAGDLGQGLGQKIVALDVGEFVQQDGAETGGGPVMGSAGQERDGAE